MNEIETVLVFGSVLSSIVSLSFATYFSRQVNILKERLRKE